jgi:hypothetical protein
MPPQNDRNIGIDTYGYDEPPDDDQPDDDQPVEDDREYDDDDPRRYGWRSNKVG